MRRVWLAVAVLAATAFTVDRALRVAGEAERAGSRPQASDPPRLPAARAGSGTGVLVDAQGRRFEVRSRRGLFRPARSVAEASRPSPRRALALLWGTAAAAIAAVWLARRYARR